MSNIGSFLKNNIGEEDIIKVLLMSAGKALVSVAILVVALFSYLKLCDWYTFNFVTTAIIMITTIALLFCSFYTDEIKTGFHGTTHDGFKWYNPITWTKHIHIKDMLYLDNSGTIGDENFHPVFMYFVSAAAGWIITSLIFLTGGALTFAYIFVSAIYIPEGALLFDIAIAGSIIGLSILFLKLKWKKIITPEGVNWNLAAWCICAAVIVTTISFIAGAAIRNLAGIIGIEYTAILVGCYTLMTGVYVYLDIRQWMDRKERERVKKEKREVKETTP